MLRWCLFLLALLPLLAHGQDADIIRHVAGIRQGTNRFFESEGYSITAVPANPATLAEDLVRFRKSFSVNRKPAQTPTAAFFPAGTQCYTAGIEHKGLTGHTVVYEIPTPDTDKAGARGLLQVGLQISGERDTALEAVLLEALLAGRLDGQLQGPDSDSIILAGRPIPKNPVCHWANIRNLSCGSSGQLNWSEFRTREKAERALATQRAENETRNLLRIDTETTVDVLFEGVPAEALKRVYHIKLPKLLTGGSNDLVVYYVVAPVRGCYVTAVMSHYVNEAPEGTLPALLREVMQLQPR